jgi:tetratricopeptide (TPR) repeat protein
MTRVVRVFVSSTFRDMRAEREELVKWIFPQLRKLCEARGVTWGEVDLRWGVTDEQKAEGKVLPICLAEIRSCRPYFLGLLGERYGWVPEAIDPGLVEEEPWLAEHRERSVTELEILHGVLNEPAMANHAFFYFRSPAYVDTLPAGEQAELHDVPGQDEIERFGVEEAERRAAGRRQKLATLKDRIRASGLPVCEDYPDARALGQLVLRDLTAVIDRLYPKGSQPYPLDCEASEQDAFAASRARVYIGRREYFEALDVHARGSGLPLVIVGESGSGKSALLANWAFDGRASRDAALVLMHFVGATAHSADWAAMLRRLLGEFRRRLGVTVETPDQPGALRRAFAEALAAAAARGRVILALDALNQLEDREGALDLAWLPRDIPPNIRLVVSALPGRVLDELARRGWPTLQVQPLDGDERRRLIAEYLAQFRKALSPARVERLAAAPQTANPLYLRALLEELRVWGDHFTLDNRIAHYLEAATADDLYERILERYEQDFERDRPGLVADAMSLLWAARRGLSEAELLDLLGSRSGPLPWAYWSPLFLAAEQSLVNRSGLLGFFHEYLRKAVYDRYISTGDAERTAHLGIAEYFRRRPLYLDSPAGGPGRAQERPLDLRKVDEEAWQYFRARSLEALRDTVTDMPFVVAMSSKLGRHEELVSYWEVLNDTFPLPASYAEPLDRFRNATRDDPDELAQGLNAVGHLYERLGYLNAAAVLLREALAALDRGDSYMSFMTATSYANLGILMMRTGQMDEAERAFLTGLNITDRVAPTRALSLRILNNLAEFYLRSNQVEKMRSTCERILSMAGAGPRSGPGAGVTSDPTAAAVDALVDPVVKQERAAALHHLAVMHDRQHEWAEAIRASEEAVDIATEGQGISPGELATYLYTLGSAYSGAGNPAKAEAALDRAARVLDNEAGGFEDPLHQGLVAMQLIRTRLRLGKTADLAARMKALKTCVCGTKRLSDEHVISTLGSLAGELDEANRLDEAGELYDLAIESAKRAGDAGRGPLPTLLNNRGSLYLRRGNNAAALDHANDALALYKAAGRADALAEQHLNVAVVHRKMGDAEQAAAAARAAREALASGPPDPLLRGRINNMLGDLSYQQSRWQDAEAAYREAVHAFEEGGQAHGGPVDHAAMHLADLYERLGRPADAERCYRRCMAIREVTLGANDPTLAITMSNYGLLLNELDRQDEARALHERALAIRKTALGERHADVGRSLSFLGITYLKMGDFVRALSHCEQARDIFRETLGGSHPKTAELEQSVVLLRMMAGAGG